MSATAAAPVAGTPVAGAPPAPAIGAPQETQAGPVDWDVARRLAYEAGRAAAGPAQLVPLAAADGRTLAEPLVTLTDLPAFRTSNIDGWAVRGTGPWRPEGRVLAGSTAQPLVTDGTCVEIATGAMVPVGARAVLRVEESRRDAAGLVDGVPRTPAEWRVPGEEARRGEEILPAGTPVDPAVLGLAASCGHDALAVRVMPTATLLVFGDELLTAGPPGAGRLRDALGPLVPAWLRRYGASVEPAAVLGPIRDSLPAHVEAIREALTMADVVCTTGGTMHGPVDHLHPALRELNAEYVVNTVAVRPGFPMLLAQVGDREGRPRLLAGLPGNPQSAAIALLTLVAPLLAGLQGRVLPPLPRVELAEPVPGRGDCTHLALVALDADARTARPVPHVGSAMLRGLAHAHGFAVIQPGTSATAGDVVPYQPLPLLTGERR